MISAHCKPSKVNWSTARLMTVAASVDDGAQWSMQLYLLRGRAARAGVRWRLRLALPTEPANLQQVVRRAVVLRGRGDSRGIMTFLAWESIRPSSLVAPLNTGRSRPRSDGSTLPLAHPRLLAQLLGWPVDGWKHHLSSGRGLNCFHVQLRLECHGRSFEFL